MEIQCSIHDESDNEMVSTKVEETDPDWLNFLKITNQEIPAGWDVEQGIIWRHKPKRVLCEALHFDETMAKSNIGEHWAKGIKNSPDEAGSIMYCLVAFKHEEAEKKLISPSWIPRCMVLGNYPELYFAYTDNLIKEQNNQIINYKSKEEKKVLK